MQANAERVERSARGAGDPLGAWDGQNPAARDLPGDARWGSALRRFLKGTRAPRSPRREPQPRACPSSRPLGVTRAALGYCLPPLRGLRQRLRPHSDVRRTLHARPSDSLSARCPCRIIVMIAARPGLLRAEAPFVAEFRTCLSGAEHAQILQRSFKA